MRVDIYRRAETPGAFSYLAVPEDKPIPQEAINTDWQPEARHVELDDDAEAMPTYHIDHPLQQISAKGYAITALNDI